MLEYALLFRVRVIEHCDMENLFDDYEIETLRTNLLLENGIPLFFNDAKQIEEILNEL